MRFTAYLAVTATTEYVLELARRSGGRPRAPGCSWCGWPGGRRSFVVQHAISGAERRVVHTEPRERQR
jgi:hypothetical protein